MKIVARDIPPRTAWALEQAGVHPLLARLYAARGVQSKEELDDGLARLLPPASMKGIDAAARLLADAMAQNLRLVIVADYDCDGATACAVGVRGLRLLGAHNVDYLVPDRVADGYGLSPSIARRVKERGADVLITVDNGIASVEGVAEAKALGLQVLVTDHHLPGPALPAADAIVNPNQPGCTFESKSMAGVGVMFYVLLALRAELRARGVFDAATQPKLDPLLTLVALGTVAANVLWYGTGALNIDATRVPWGEGGDKSAARKAAGYSEAAKKALGKAVAAESATGFAGSVEGSDSSGGRFLSQVRLPGPVGGVASVMIDGELIAADRYRVDDGVYLVSLDEDLKWPASQDLRAANDEDGAFAVTYWHGAAPNSLVNVAVAALANEFYLALARDKACRLPSGVRSVARQGVVVEIDTMLFEGGYTRIREVDAVIRMYNPHRMVGQPRVLSPDVSKVRTPTFGGL